MSPATARQRMEMFRQAGDAAGERAFWERIGVSRWDASAFLKLLKQRFTQLLATPARPSLPGTSRSINRGSFQRLPDGYAAAGHRPALRPPATLPAPLSQRVRPPAAT